MSLRCWMCTLLSLALFALVCPRVLAAEDELPGLGQEAAQEEAEAAAAKPRKMWYYDFRNSQKLCLTDEEARRERFSKQAAIKPCDK